MSTALAACGGSIINMGCGAEGDGTGDGTGGSGDGAINPGATKGAYDNNGTVSADCSESQNDIYWEPVEGATVYRLSRDGTLIYEGTATTYTDTETTGDHAYLLESVLADGTIKNEILSVNQADCIAQTNFEGGDANSDGLSIQVQCLDAENLQILWDYTGEYQPNAYQLIITDSIDGELVNEPQISPYTLTNLLNTSLSAGGQLTIAVEATVDGDVVATESVIVTEDCTSSINILGITCDPTTIYLEYQAVSVTDPVTVALIGDVATVDEDLGVVDGINTVTFNRVDFESPNNVVNIVFTDSGSGAIITQQLDVNLTQTCADNPVPGNDTDCTNLTTETIDISDISANDALWTRSDNQVIGTATIPLSRFATPPTKICGMRVSNHTYVCGDDVGESAATFVPCAADLSNTKYPAEITGYTIGGSDVTVQWRYVYGAGGCDPSSRRCSRPVEITGGYSSV